MRKMLVTLAVACFALAGTVVTPNSAWAGNTRPHISTTVRSLAPSAVAPSAVAPSAVAAVCGYNDNIDGWAVYRHCGDVNVVIEVDVAWPFTNYAICVKPGDTTLGATWFVTNAWYIGGVNCDT